MGCNIHIEDIVNLLKYEDLRGVVLVRNQLQSGMVITGVADQVPELIAHIVYLDAFVPQDGQSMLDIVPPDRRPPVCGRLARAAIRTAALGKIGAGDLAHYR